jgi:hypothetical protein
MLVAFCDGMFDLIPFEYNDKVIWRPVAWMSSHFLWPHVADDLTGYEMPG